MLYYLNKEYPLKMLNAQLHYNIEIGNILIIYSILKSITGILIFILPMIEKNKVLYGKKNLLFLLPITVTIVLYVCSFCYVTYKANNDFNEITIIMLAYFLILVGLFMWLIFLTFYNIELKPIKRLMLNILTPLNLVLYVVIIIYNGP